MSKKKLAGIIAGSIIGTFILIIIIVAIAAPTPKYTLSVSVSPSGSGSVSPSGGEYESGVQVTLTASADSGYTFDYWSGSTAGTSPTVTITMDSDKSLIANFEPITAVRRNLTISVNGQGATNPSVGTHEYDNGTQVTITASPASGWKFDRWSGDISDTSPTIAITLDSDKDITAHFEEETPPTTPIIIITYSSMTTTQIGTGFFPDEPESGNVFLVLDMTINNQGYDSFNTNQFYFSVIVDNVEYSTAFVVHLDNKLESVDILDGGTVQGKLAFEVPEKVNILGFEVVYDAWDWYNIEWIRQ
jgi:uncharacterized repeat protein (TIGR02543 family)